MSIKTKLTQQDLKIYASERLTQNDDGGGFPTAKPLTGALNELFAPISSIARVNGAFYAVLEYMGVLRPDDAPLIGGFAAITRPPKDKTVSYTMFKATRFAESRAEILKRIESYNVATIESKLTLFSTQSKNSRVVQAYQRVGESLPMVGDVYCLRQNMAGYPYAEQYIQVTRIVKAEDRLFTNPQTGKDFTRTVVQLEISTKLQTDFIGADYPSENYINNPCKIRETGVADAAQFYGVKPITQAIKKEVMQIKIDSIMEKLVPTNQISVPLTDLTAAGQIQTLFDGAKVGADGIITLSVNKQHNAGATSSVYFGNAIMPSSVIIGSNAGDITDKGGTLYLVDKAVGSIDYGNGLAMINEPTFTAYLNVAKFRPASNAIKVADTARINVDINNRADIYTLTIDPPPAVGTLQVSYRSKGDWYTLQDDGSGVLRGASTAHGSGSINFATGTAQISLTELPDVNSAILWAWGSDGNYFNRSGIATTAKMLLQLAQDADPASLTLNWAIPSSGGTVVNKTATSDALGKITGDWTGKYDPQTHQIRIDTGAKFNHPVGVLDIVATYNKSEKLHQEFKAPLRDAQGQIILDLGDKEIKPNTVKMRWNLLIENYDAVYTTTTSTTLEVNPTPSRSWVDPYKTVRDDGNGNIVDETGVQVGTIDYTARKITFKPDTVVKIPKAVYKNVLLDSATTTATSQDGNATATTTAKTYRTMFDKFEYIEAGATMPIDESGLVEVWYYDTSPQSQVVETLKSGTIEIDLLPNYAEVIAPASVNFIWGAKRYFDKNGSLFCDLNPVTGASKSAGTLDYQSGKALINNWTWTDGANPNVYSLATSIDGNPVDAVTFRTPTAPIRAGSLQIRATAVDGTKVTATSDYTGNITGTWVVGKADFEYGLADLRFGKWVTATGHENEPWYNADAIKDGKIWQPLHVFAETITFNASGYTYLPIDNAVVKIDTVRLPQDGRVPIFRRGDSILIRNSKVDILGSAFTGSQTVQLSRNDLDRICLVDSDNKAVDANIWDYDLEAGTITFSPSIDLSGYKLPLKAHHSREQRNRITDLNIDGTLSLQFPVNRDYEIEDTYVSSLMIFEQELAVWHSVPFTQRSWNNVWQDTPNGDQLLNKLNLRDFPMKLTDDGTITERWMFDWLTATQFNFYGEASGYIGKFDILTDFAPINPATGKPFMWIDKRAFSGMQGQSTWATHDNIRINTRGTLVSVWVLCAAQPNANPPVGEDGFEQYLFGDTVEDKGV